LACLAVFVAGWAACGAFAVTFYRWVDKDGNVHYSDAPPKDSKDASGPVTRVEVDPDRNVTAPLSPGAAAEERGSGKAKPAQDLLEQRRETRDALQARLDAAREKLEAAKAALASASAGDDETQVIQQKFGPAGQPPGTPDSSSGGGLGMGGMHGMAPRSNCTTNAKTKVTTCATVVGNEKYAERIAQLEEAVKRAELEVEEAERAYRRGVD
jgi:hypothetical protein